MGTAIVVVILVLCIGFAIMQSIKHMKGEGGCCGGGEMSEASTEKKKLENPAIGKKVISIEGMTCDHCKNSVERSINRIEGASGTVNLKKNIAEVEYDREIDDDVLRIAVERLDYKVVSITDQKI